MMPTTWLPCALSDENVMWLPSELGQGRIHCKLAWTVCTLPVASHTITPAVVLK